MVRHSGTWFAFTDSCTAFVVPNLSGVTMWTPNNCKISSKSALASPEDRWDLPVASMEGESRQVFRNCHPPAAFYSLICKLSLPSSGSQSNSVRSNYQSDTGPWQSCLQTNHTLVSKYIYRNRNAFSDHLWKRYRLWVKHLSQEKCILICILAIKEEQYYESIKYI